MIKGLYKTKFRGVHASMKDRCNNPNNKAYKHYGGRGITVCEKWQTAQGFAEDMYSSYSSGLSIERVDVNGNYCPENCVWIPKSLQWKNKRNSFITCNGTSLRISEWANELGISKKVLWYTKKKWDVPYEEVISRIKSSPEKPAITRSPQTPAKKSGNGHKAKTYVKPVIVNGIMRHQIIDSITHVVRNII